MHLDEDVAERRLLGMTDLEAPPCQAYLSIFCQPKVFLWVKIITTNISVKRMAIWLEGNVGSVLESGWKQLEGDAGEAEAWNVVITTTIHVNKMAELLERKSVAYRGEGGGGFGVFKPPPKFRRYRWSPQSHKQEEPASRFPFVVHCVLIRL